LKNMRKDREWTAGKYFTYKLSNNKDY
jgi:hypothetical protein